MRTTLVLASLSLASSAFAARDLRFYLAYGDAGFAGLNGSSVGSEMKPLSAVPAIGSKFTVSVYIHSLATSEKAYTAGNVFLGFDMATTTNSTMGYASLGEAHAAGVSKKVAIDGSFTNWATSLPGLDGSIPTSVNLQPVGDTRYRGEALGRTNTTFRSIGINQGVGCGLGNSLAVGTGAFIRLFDLTITNLGIGAEQYGDAGTENGLTLNSCPTLESSGVNFFAHTTGGTVSTMDGQLESTVKYRLGTVPEPPVWLALGAGLVAISRRRHR